MHRAFPELVPAPGAREAASARFRDFRDRLHGVDQTNYLESLLMRQDKMAMAASVEARVPFVHLPLARVVNAIPRAVTTPGGDTKPLLKKIAAPYLPKDLLHRRKVGLTLPAQDWLRDPAGLGRYLDDVAAPTARLAAFADPSRLGQAVDDFRTGRRGRRAQCHASRQYRMLVAQPSACAGQGRGGVMCGIVGIADMKSLDPAACEARLRRALDRLAPRGPDGEGVWSDAHCLLGHRRLAIVDLSPAGAQPMARGKLSAVFNGMIYNFRETPPGAGRPWRALRLAIRHRGSARGLDPLG